MGLGVATGTTGLEVGLGVTIGSTGDGVGLGLHSAGDNVGCPAPGIAGPQQSIMNPLLVGQQSPIKPRSWHLGLEVQVP